MLQFVKNDQECRLIQVYRYFDHQVTQPCGICDVCLNMRKLGLVSEKTNEITSKILNLLPTTASNLENQLIEEDNLLISKILKFHFESGQLAMDGQGLIYKK